MPTINDKIEIFVLSNLLYNAEYGRKVIPYLKEEYFQNTEEKIIFRVIRDFITEYRSLPTKEAILILINEKNVASSEDQYKKICDIVTAFSNNNQVDEEFLLKVTEEFCQEEALRNGLSKSIEIFQNTDGKLSKGQIPDIMREAISVNFDSRVGHDYFNDAMSRFEFYQRKEEKFPVDLEMFNRITQGGFSRKTLTLLISGTGVGKTLCQCHFAASFLSAGKSVLYITLEMSEERIAQRIDANLLNIPINDLETLPKNNFEKGMVNIKNHCGGKLFIKEYPTASASVLQFRHLLNELKNKKNFVPDVVFVDYLNIAVSSRFKAGGNVAMYSYIKAIAEELRGLAVEFNIPVFSASQLNRCIFEDSIVVSETGKKKIKDLVVGDRVLTKFGKYNSVLAKHNNKNTEVYEITTESGKKIICSGNHLFPTSDGKTKSINTGLSTENHLIINNCEAIKETRSYDSKSINSKKIISKNNTKNSKRRTKKKN